MKFIYNIWISQYHGFTWSCQPMTYIYINILALTHIEPMFHFWTPENFSKLFGFLKFLLLECSCKDSTQYCGSEENNLSIVQHTLWMKPYNMSMLHTMFCLEDFFLRV